MLLGAAVGLIDLDDAAVGPAELDLGNLCAHLDLLGRRAAQDVRLLEEALLEAYAAAAGGIDERLLECCRALTTLRLACIHGDGSLVASARGAALA